MRRFGDFIVTFIVVVAWAAPAGAEVRVSFVHPEQYTDAGRHQGYGAEIGDPDLQELKRYFERLGKEYLRPDQKLTIDVLDIDLAGRCEPLSAGGYNDVRIMREVTWPRIAVRYTLTDGERVVASGEESISDKIYLSRPEGKLSSDPLVYEKAMLEAWFRARFIVRP